MLNSHTLYLDASGDPGWPKPFGKSPLKYYVMGGIALTPSSDHIAHVETDRILKKYIPDKQRRLFPPEKYELHYHPLSAGREIFNHLTHPQRLAMADEVFTLIDSLDPVLFASVVDKERLKRKHGISAFHPTQYALRSIVDRFCMYLERVNEVGAVYLDEEEYKKDKSLRQMIHSFRRKGTAIRGFFYRPSHVNRLERILNAISFTPSEMSPGTQLADFISRTTWLHFERNKSRRFNQVKHWDTQKGVQYEPCVIPR